MVSEKYNLLYRRSSLSTTTYFLHRAHVKIISTFNKFVCPLERKTLNQCNYWQRQKSILQKSVVTDDVYICVLPEA